MKKEIFYLVHYNNGDYFIDDWSNKNADPSLYINAKRYKTITGAIKNLYPDKIRFYQAKKIVNLFEEHPSIKRQKKLHRINGENFIPNYEDVKIFDTGRIELIEIKGNDIKHLGEINKSVIYNYFLEKRNTLEKTLPKIYPEILKNIEEGNINDDFWN